jgi:carboxylesterase type B
LGSKDFLGGVYSGSHLINLSGGDMIYVAANYRLGVYGWLAGYSMEHDPTATTNVGLYDQRFALEWIQKYIHFFGGDKAQVTCAGESAGVSQSYTAIAERFVNQAKASSVLHHLVAFGGKQDPLFKRAILMSPAFQPMGDRRRDGQLEKVFNNVTEAAGCKGKGLACLRTIPASKLDEINQKVQDDAPRGTFAVGPAPDGKWIEQYTAAELSAGNVFPVESVIVSNTEHEGYIFVDGHIRDNKQFDNLIVQLFGDITQKLGLVESIQKHYPPVDEKSLSSKYKTETERVMDFIQDSAFACNTRFIAQAYPGKTWSYLWTPLGGWHGTDIIGLYLRAELRIGNNTIPTTPGLGAFTRTFQSYLVSYAVTGDPNTKSIKTPGLTTVAAVPWSKVPAAGLQSQDMQGVLVAGNGTFVMGTNSVVPRDRCSFLQEMQKEVSKFSVSL